MKAGNFWTVIIVASLIAVSCDQDAIFQIIASETAPRKPRIEGSPTNMVLFERVYPDPVEGDPDNTKKVPIMYVASGRLHWYAKASDGTPQWDSNEYKIPQPDGKIMSLAVTDKRLYALCRDGYGIKAKLRYIENNENKWKTINSTITNIQNIFADPEKPRLFAGAGGDSDDTYDILYLNNDNTLRMLQKNTTLLSGAVWQESNYYLSTRGKGIFYVDENVTSLKQLDGAAARFIISMIKLEDDSIIAIERKGGALYEVNSGSFAPMKYSFGKNASITTGGYATTALALWEDHDDPNRKLLIAGVQGQLSTTIASSFNYGYVEFGIKGDGTFDTGFARRDSSKDTGNLMSVHDQERYTTSLGKRPVKHLFQAPKEIDPNMTFFASTQIDGLWSYRYRPDNGGWQWNAEE